MNECENKSQITYSPLPLPLLLSAPFTIALARPSLPSIFPPYTLTIVTPLPWLPLSLPLLSPLIIHVPTTM